MERFYAIHNTPIFLGRQGENNAREIAFDISHWVEAYGEGAVLLMVRRSGEETMYPVPLCREENTVLWTVTDSDVAVVGQTGECELSYQPGEDVLAKSETWATFVLPSMDGEVTEAPDPARSWIDALRAATQANQQIADDASASATQAAQSAGIAGTRAGAAAQSAAAAEAARDAIVGMEVQASSLPANESATAESELVDGVYRMAFGIPRGETGPAGQDGTVAFEDLTQAQIEMLRGPQGEQGIQGLRGEPGEGVPAVTAADNGKFLRVVDGVWAAEALTNVDEEGA